MWHTVNSATDSMRYIVLLIHAAASVLDSRLINEQWQSRVGKKAKDRQFNNWRHTHVLAGCLERQTKNIYYEDEEGDEREKNRTGLVDWFAVVSTIILVRKEPCYYSTALYSVGFVVLDALLFLNFFLPSSSLFHFFCCCLRSVVSTLSLNFYLFPLNGLHSILSFIFTLFSVAFIHILNHESILSSKYLIQWSRSLTCPFARLSSFYSVSYLCNNVTY